MLSPITTFKAFPSTSTPKMGTYYDLDAILTDATKVPTTIDISVPGLGYLDGNPGAALSAGAKLALPLWLAEMLAVSQTADGGAMATLDMPEALGARVLNALRADPRSVDLRRQAAHFYALGARMLELFEEDELVDVLSEVRLWFCYGFRCVVGGIKG